MAQFEKKEHAQQLDTMDRGQSQQDQIGRYLLEERMKTEQMARQLSHLATDQWQKAILGMVAFPAAISAGFAATTLYVVSFIARGFEVFQRSAMDVRSEAMNEFGQGRNDRHRADVQGNLSGQSGQSNQSGQRQGGPETPRA